MAPTDIEMPFSDEGPGLPAAVQASYIQSAPAVARQYAPSSPKLGCKRSYEPSSPKTRLLRARLSE